MITFSLVFSTKSIFFNDLKEDSFIEGSRLLEKIVDFPTKTRHFCRYNWEKLVSASLDFQETGKATTRLCIW